MPNLLFHIIFLTLSVENTDCVIYIQNFKVLKESTFRSKKSRVALAQLFLTLNYRAEYFIISITFIFNLCFLYFVIDKLPAFIIIV